MKRDLHDEPRHDQAITTFDQIDKSAVNEVTRKPCKIRDSEPRIYNLDATYYSPTHDRRPPPLSKKNLKKQRGRSVQRAAEYDTMTNRQRLLALISRAPDSALVTLLPVVQATLSPRASTGQLPPRSFDRKRQFKLIGDTCTQSRARNGKLQLPKLPKGLSWPTKRYVAENLAHGISIVQFLREEWADLITHGYGELRWLRLVDKGAARAIYNYQRPHPKTKERRVLPEDLHFLREKEVTDLKAACGLEAVEFDPRLPEALAGRVRRGVAVLVR